MPESALLALSKHDKSGMFFSCHLLLARKPVSVQGPEALSRKFALHDRHYEQARGGRQDSKRVSPFEASTLVAIA